jgi:hypothetical protein
MYINASRVEKYYVVSFFFFPSSGIIISYFRIDNKFTTKSAATDKFRVRVTNTTRKPVQRPKRLNTTLTDSHSTGKPVSQRESDCPECAGESADFVLSIGFYKF